MDAFDLFCILYWWACCFFDIILSISDSYSMIDEYNNNIMIQVCIMFIMYVVFTVVRKVTYLCTLCMYGYVL
jgi:hypothetical protein